MQLDFSSSGISEAARGLAFCYCNAQGSGADSATQRRDHVVALGCPVQSDLDWIRDKQTYFAMGEFVRYGTVFYQRKLFRYSDVQMTFCTTVHAASRSAFMLLLWRAGLGRD